MKEERYCTNCRTPLADDASACPSCGVFAGDVFDGKLPRKRRSRAPLLIVVALIALAAGAALYLATPRKPRPPKKQLPVRVVKDRPGGARRGEGAKINEAEAMMTVRRYLTASRVSEECLAMMSKGYSGGAYHVTALNRCGHTRLGQFTVDGETGKVK